MTKETNEGISRLLKNGINQNKKFILYKNYDKGHIYSENDESNISII